MNPAIFLFDPADFDIIFRNEGKYPSRVASPILTKYRESKNQDMGLFLTNNEDWWKLRQPLNKTMMRANAAYPYLDMQDPVGDELVEILKGNLRKNGNNRDPMVMQEMYRWALESVCAVVFDRRMGCLDPNLKKNSWQQIFVDTLHKMFESMASLILNPRHTWAYSLGYKTKKWKAFEAGMGIIDDTSIRLMEESQAEWKENPDLDLSKRFLPQLLGIESLTMSQKVSVIFDMFAAQDTTTYLSESFSTWPKVQRLRISFIRKFASM
jgi:cytochrome P450